MIVNVEQDSSGELLIPLDPTMLEELGWSIGDELTWTDNGDGTYSITKVEKLNENCTSE